MPAFDALGRLIEPKHAGETEEVEATRHELGVLVRLVDAEVHERTATLDAAQIRIHALRVCHALSIGAGARSSAMCIDAFAMKAEPRPVKTPHGIALVA